MSGLTETHYQLIIQKCHGAGIDAIWEMFNPRHCRWTKFPATLTETFELRKEAFMATLERMLADGVIKLHKDGRILNNEIKELIQNWRNAWPTTEAPYPTAPDIDFSLWFFDKSCPAGVAWRQPDGSYQIAD